MDPGQTSLSPRRARRNKAITVILFSFVWLTLFAISYAVDPLGTLETGKADLLTLGGFVSQIGVLVWCLYDQHERNARVPGFYNFLVFFVPPIGLPIDAFKTRGRSGFKLIALGFLFVFLLLASTSILVPFVEAL